MQPIITDGVVWSVCWSVCHDSDPYINGTINQVVPRKHVFS